MKLVSLFRLLRSLPGSIYFNFHYLPFRQAVKLPILLYKPRFLKLKGHVRIDSEEIKTGMVQLGFPMVSLYPNSGIMIENHGGEILFKGKAKIGNASAVSIGPKGRVEFGERYNATAALKLTSYHSIRFAPRVLCAWECTFMDTDFHKLTKVNVGGVFQGLCPYLHRFRYLVRHALRSVERYGAARLLHHWCPIPVERQAGCSLLLCPCR